MVLNHRDHCSLKLKVLLKQKCICIENITVVLPKGGLKIEGRAKTEWSDFLIAGTTVETREWKATM